MLSSANMAFEAVITRLTLITHLVPLPSCSRLESRWTAFWLSIPAILVRSSGIFKYKMGSLLKTILCSSSNSRSISTITHELRARQEVSKLYWLAKRNAAAYTSIYIHIYSNIIDTCTVSLLPLYNHSDKT